MDMDLEQMRYEPLPRWGHVSVVIGNKLYLWGGRIEDFSEESKKELASVVEVFDFETELWEKKATSGTPPPGLYNTAYTTIDHCLYVYGGWDGQLTYNNLHKLDVLTMTWTELKPTETSEVPMKMSGCGLVNCGKNKLVLFGGCGVPTEDSQQSSIPKSTSGAVSYTTVRSNEGSHTGASQEETVRLLEVTSGLEVSVQAEVHSQPDSIPSGSLTEGMMGLYDLAASQINSQMSRQSLSQPASSQGEATTQPPETKTESHADSQAQNKSEEVREESKTQPQSQEKGEALPQTQKEDAQASSLAQETEGVQEQSQLLKKQEDEQSKEKEGDQVQSHPQEKEQAPVVSQSQEKEGAQSESQSKEITTQSVPQENGEVKVQPKSQENGVPKIESQNEKETESQSHSQESGASKPSSPEKAPPATTIPQSQQNGEIEAQPPAVKEAESKKPSEMEIQPQSQSQSQSQPAEEESEEESDDGSDVMDRRWTNELKVFDLQESAWTTPVAHGDFPPPCVDFTFTCVDDCRSVMYGGFQPEAGTSSEAYILNMETWLWTKLAGGDGASEDVAWPVGRDGHASCLLAGAPNPQVLISGGWDKDNKLINDAWILNINERIWKELTMPVIVGARFWHSVSCYQFSRRMKQLLFFGGCPGAPEELISGGCWAKLAATVIVELGLMDPILPVISTSQLSVADEVSIPSNWVVLDATDQAQLGLPNKRLKERVLLAEYRAIRAENIAREVLKKIETIDLHMISTPYQPLNGNKDKKSNTAIPNGKLEPEKEEETQKEAKPFWEISKKDVELTGVDIGKGRWSIVREATYRSDRVAARCLYSKIISEDNFKVFIECMDTAAKLRHKNLLPFIGAVLEGEPIIITELMPFNLKKVLEKKGQLLNYQIVGIALDVARALNFLHTTEPDPVVHGDLTSTSVLLEQGSGNSWRAKLSDFMTAKFFKQLLASGIEFDHVQDRRSMSPASPSVNNPKHSAIGSSGTSGRSSRERRSRSSSIGSESGKMNRKVSTVTPPDILDPTNLTPKRDVYSFGLLLVEMCSGSTPHLISLPFLIESITWTEMSSLIRDCIELEPESRPSMDDILPKIGEMHQSLSIGYGPSRPVIKKTFV